ncbi:glycosyl transferase family 11 [Chitinophaga skermanii]|uniref:Glycosyl transferase family 11 n=1 Tax=Chitinophaga skermanii TaxID=331697 RepID=A0A327R3E3_9BACT|nr:alpha-1,2-fucosyltransferase [Chitinophaga skermanii]RAJ08397.1 glycosyl transferase family 11 [Chitinophaga skermanii]
MVIVQLKGGLGNQMFQYAAGRCLSLQHQSPLLLDINSYDAQQLRRYDLDCFNIEAGLSTEADVRQFDRSFLRKVFDRLLPAHKRKMYRELHFHFDPGFYKATPPLYLKGYWQSEQYFKPVEEQIRRDFTFKTPFSAAVEEKAVELRGRESVAVHFRRGDYKDPEMLRVHGIVGLDYYDAAIMQMQATVPGAKFYIFTDDPEWVRTNVPWQVPLEILSGNLTHTHLEDLYLMSQCRHQIIANSSFSWWAAWLNKNADKQVFTPQKWFGIKERNTKDLIPAAWKRL